MKSVFSFRLVVALILYVSFFESLGQSNPFIHYSVPEGLPSSETYNVYQDKKGFIWFATDNGVVRFDGRDMDVFQANEGLSDPVVFEFIEDHKERLWFRTYSGKISYFFNEKIYSYPYNDTLATLCKNSILQSLYIDSKDLAWFGTGYSIVTIDRAGKVNGEIENEISEVSFKNVENEIIQSHGSEINVNKAALNGKRIPFHKTDSIGHRSIFCTVKWRGNQYFSFGGSIYKLEDKLITPVFFRENKQIITLTVDHHDNLWIGYFKNGVECYSDFGVKKSNHFSFTDSKSVTKVFQDRQGGYWISTLEDGIYYVPDITFYIEPTPSSLRIHKAVSWGKKVVAADINGELIILDADGKVEQKKKLFGSMSSLLLGPRNKLWVSTGEGTFVMDDSFHLNLVKLSNFSDMHLANDSTVWGAINNQLYHFNKDGQSLKTKSSNTVHRLIYTNERFLFRFGRLGVEVSTFDDKVVKLPSFFDALKITKILPLNDSLLLFGTLGSGFIIVNQNNWTYDQFSSKRKFIANNIYSLLKEGSDLWIGTEKGVAIASVKSIISGSPDFSFFLTKDKTTYNKINHLVSGPRYIMAFSEDSFFMLPKEMKPSSLPLFRIQNLLVNNHPDSMRAHQKLSADQNNIQINFKLIDFRNNNILIRSRLSPKDDWSYSSDRSIKFYSLRSASYHLEIEYSIDNIRWHKATLWDFTILPPWWRIWYFQTTLILIALLWMIIYFKRRVARVNERNRLINEQQQNLIRAELETLEAERNRIAKDLHDSVGTNLTAIKMTVRSILKKHHDSKAEAVENEFQNTIQDLKGIIHDLVPAGLDKYGLTEIVRGHAAKIEESLEIKIEVNSFGPDIKDPKLNLLSFRILQELLSNTLKHSLANKVVIDINSFDDLLSILYQDNGKGFDLELVARGSGLYNIQSRVQVANGTIKFESGNFGVSYFIDLPLNPNGNDQNHFS